MKNNLFNSVKLSAPKSNTFDLTHDVKMSGLMGNLMPTLVLEVIPGDKINLGCDSLLRFAPLIAPVMHRLDVTMHYFYVPNRILWPNWEKFITDPSSGLNMPTLDVTPQLSADQLKFLDYMGIPGSATTYEVNALPLAAYQMIYQEYYRDQNLVADVVFELTDGDNSGNPDLTVLRKRAWEHDYFTAALPWAQKGAGVDLPLGVIEIDPNFQTGGSFKNTMSNMPDGAVSQLTGDIVVGGQWPNAYDPEGTLIVQPTTINDLRRAFKLQEWLEKAARGGSRYIENILIHFGIKSSDSRLQRPEYITGVKSPVIISEILNTTGENSGLPQGNMAGHAVSVANGKLGYYNAEDHGYIIGVMSVMPKTCYQQGIPKTYLKRDSLDYFWPSFAHLGEQAIVAAEIDVDSPIMDAKWGYIPRYAEYKYMPSRVAGDFKTTLDFWHLGRIFGSPPALNQEFIECDPADVNRIFAVVDGTDLLYIHILHKITAIRLMPKFGTPSF